MSRFSKDMQAAAKSLCALPEGLWEGLMERSSPVLLERRQTLFSAGDEARGCYVVQAGALKAVLRPPDGHERMLAVFGQGALVGETALFDDQPRTATVVAIRDSKLAHLSKETFLHFADSHPEVYRHALRILAARLRDAEEDAQAQGATSVTCRVAKTFLQLADSLGETLDADRRRIAQRITQSDIAAMAGVARENASRVVSRWMKEKILSRTDGYYVIERRKVLALEAGG